MSLALLGALTMPVSAHASFGFLPGNEGFAAGPENENGSPATQAGSHPYAFTVNLNFNQTTYKGYIYPEGDPRDVHTVLPAGMIGNPTAVAQCTAAQFGTFEKAGVPTSCPASSAIGTGTVLVSSGGGGGINIGHTPNAQGFPVFNLVPPPGAPAAFGFNYFGTEVTLTPHIRQDGSYGITVDSIDTSQTLSVFGAKVTIWGVPYAHSHDAERGNCAPCSATGAAVPYLTLPTSCTGSFDTKIVADSWQEPGTYLPDGEPDLSDPDWIVDESTSPGLTGCNQLAFNPTFAAEPTTDRASAPSGLEVNLDFHDEGLTNPEGRAQSQLNKTVVTLPEGLTINPSAGVGLGGCTEADFGRETLQSAPGAGCPNDSKLGTVEVQTPLLATPVPGSLFIAQPYENQFSEPGHPTGTLVAIYIVLKDPLTGVLIKLAGKVTPNPVTGQLVTTFENNPQLPFDHFNFHFREGQQAPLISPATCGTYQVKAALSPWSEPSTVLTETSPFQITKGYEGGACPSGGAPPFNPQLQAGSYSNTAGSYSPFYFDLTRTDAEQEISGFSTDLPPGLTGNLTGVPFCPEVDIALARTKTGVEEEANPSCPAASEVGHTLVGTGVGAVLAYVPGKLYLAGPFEGAPFSIVSVTSAHVGPFDLGTVVLRFGLNVNPYTAQVSVNPSSSEPIPTIIDGIVTHVRDIRVYVDRNDFTLNPTSCDPMAIGSTLSAHEGGSATITSPYKVTNCQALKFAPKFAVATSAKTSKANGASLHVNLTYPSGPQGTYADIAKVKVELPKQLPSRLTTLQKACTAAQFEANPAGCPSPSVIGTAKAVVPNIPEPLSGPVYFVSHGGEAFPSLEMVLQGYGVKVILVGATFISKAGITSTTFKAIPDNPVTSFELTFPEGPYSALAANGNLCTQKLTMPSDFTGQNGLEADYKTAVTVTGCPKVKALTRAQKLKAALAACHKKFKHNKARREQCERTARKRYGAVKKSKKKG